MGVCVGVIGVGIGVDMGVGVKYAQIALYDLSEGYLTCIVGVDVLT